MSRNIRIIGYYEAKLRVPGDRVTARGDKIEGGKTFSRHYEASNYKAAQKRAQKYADRFHTKVVSVMKVHPDDIIGRSIDWNLKDIIGQMPYVPPIVKKDVILENRTLDEMIFVRKHN